MIFAHPLMAVFAAALFFVLCPGVLLSIPPRGSVVMKAAVHAIVFAIVYQLSHKAVWKALYAK